MSLGLVAYGSGEDSEDEGETEDPVVTFDISDESDEESKNIKKVVVSYDSSDDENENEQSKSGEGIVVSYGSSDESEKDEKVAGDVSGEERKSVGVLVAYGSGDESEEEIGITVPAKDARAGVRQAKPDRSRSGTLKLGLHLPPPKNETSESGSGGLNLPASQNEPFETRISDDESEAWNGPDTSVTTAVDVCTGAKLLSSLPPPKPSQKWDSDVPEEEDMEEDAVVKDGNTSKDQPKQLKQPIKISIPALADLQDDDEPLAKKVKPAAKGSGLFSLLPAPKNSATKEVNRPLVPHVLTKTKLPVPNPPVTKIVNPSKNALQMITDFGEESDEDDAVVAKSSSGDFFSLNSEDKTEVPVELPVDEISEKGFSADDLTSEELMPQQHRSPNTRSRAGTSALELEDDVPEEDLAPGVPTVERNKFFDDDAIFRLAGKRGKQGGITIIDVTSDQVMPNSREWLTKQLTEEQSHHSHRRHHGPTAQQRRKHQITYLAHQAKERELELKNQWSNNRMTRKQTQAKYGF